MVSDTGDGPLSFPRDDAALPTIVGLCRGADWETLSRYYDLSDAEVGHADLEAELAERDDDEVAEQARERTGRQIEAFSNEEAPAIVEAFESRIADEVGHDIDELLPGWRDTAGTEGEDPNR